MKFRTLLSNTSLSFLNTAQALACFLLVGQALAQSAHRSGAEPLLADVFTDNAVFQRDKPVVVWGWAAPGVMVDVEFAGSSFSTTTTESGRWSVTFPEQKSGGPYELAVGVNDGEVQRRKNIMVGDVWLCSGQSNMEWPMRLASNADWEIKTSSYPEIRLLNVGRQSSAYPKAGIDSQIQWEMSTPNSVRDFSAACYYFGRELHQKLDIPIGLIHASWGGSVARAWTSAPALQFIGGYEDLLELNQQWMNDPETTEARWLTIEKQWWESNDIGVQQTPSWSEMSPDSSGWKTILVPRVWEEAGIPELQGFDGIVWFQRAFEVTEEQAAKNAEVSLGPIDDWSTTWVNGNLIGESDGWYEPRHHSIPMATLKPGRNVLTVRILDRGGQGGFLGRNQEMYVRTGDGRIHSLVGEWSFRLSKPLHEISSIPARPWVGHRGVSTLYNGMISAIAPYSLKGVAWYQGESDAADPKEYSRLLPNLFRDWRRAFDAPQLPFLVVQLAGYGAAKPEPENSAFAEVREVQRVVVENDLHSALVVTIDIGDRYTIHPSNKQEVGRRLSLAAFGLMGESTEVVSGFFPVAAAFSGNDVIVSLSNTGDGLSVLESNRPMGFQVCNDDPQCTFTDAELLEDDRIVLKGPSISNANRVRYCWADSPMCNLVNSAGLPGTPFELTIE